MKGEHKLCVKLTGCDAKIIKGLCNVQKAVPPRIHGFAVSSTAVFRYVLLSQPVYTALRDQHLRRPTAIQEGSRGIARHLVCNRSAAKRMAFGSAGTLRLHYAGLGVDSSACAIALGLSLYGASFSNRANTGLAFFG